MIVSSSCANQNTVGLFSVRLADRPRISTEVRRLILADQKSPLPGEFLRRFGPTVLKQALLSGGDFTRDPAFAANALAADSPDLNTRAISIGLSLGFIAGTDAAEKVPETAEYAAAAKAIALLVAGATLVDSGRFLYANITAEDILACGQRAQPVAALQAMLLRRVGGPLIDPDLEHIPAGPTRGSIASMLEDPFADVRRIDDKSLQTTFDLNADQLAAYAKATLLDQGLAERGYAVGLTFTSGLRAIFLDALPYILAAPRPYAIHAIEDCTVYAPLLPGHWEITLVAKKTRLSDDNTGILKRSRTITRDGRTIAESTSTLFIGSDLRGASVPEAPADFGRAHFPFSGRVREDQIDAFAAASGDFQIPHMDADAAYELTGERRRILHGMASFSRAVSLALGEIPGLVGSESFNPFTISTKFTGVVQAGDVLEFALAPASNGLGAVLVRNRDTGKLLLTSTFRRADPKPPVSPAS